MTRFVEIPNRGHSLTIDDGWDEVAQVALDFIRETVAEDSAARNVASDAE